MKTKGNVFRRFLTVCLAAALVFAMALPVGAASGYSCSYKSVTAKPGDKASSLKKKVGAKQKKSPSCAAGGYDYIYDGKDIKLETYTTKKSKSATEYIRSITFKTKKPKTKEGVKIGSSLKTVKNKYKKTDSGKTPADGVNTFSKGKTKLQISIKKGKVTGIRYLKKN